MGHASIPLQVRNKRYCGMNYTVNIDNDLISLKARHNRMVDDDVTAYLLEYKDRTGSTASPLQQLYTNNSRVPRMEREIITAFTYG